MPRRKLPSSEKHSRQAQLRVLVSSVGAAKRNREKNRQKKYKREGTDRPPSNHHRHRHNHPRVVIGTTNLEKMDRCRT